MKLSGFWHALPQEPYPVSYFLWQNRYVNTALALQFPTWWLITKTKTLQILYLSRNVRVKIKKKIKKERKRIRYKAWSWVILFTGSDYVNWDDSYRLYLSVMIHRKQESFLWTLGTSNSSNASCFFSTHISLSEHVPTIHNCIKIYSWLPKCDRWALERVK